MRNCPERSATSIVRESGNARLYGWTSPPTICVTLMRWPVAVSKTSGPLVVCREAGGACAPIDGYASSDAAQAVMYERRARTVMGTSGNEGASQNRGASRLGTLTHGIVEQQGPSRPSLGYNSRRRRKPMAFALTVNGTVHAIDADPQTPLLWVIREHVGLTGTKFSCGIGQCGACTVHIDGRATRSCSVPASSAIGKSILTIEGVSTDGNHPVQVAWKEFDAPQCGYCQSGMIMTTLALLQRQPNPSDGDIDAQVTNICRCGTYHRVRQAIHRAAALMKG